MPLELKTLRKAVADGSDLLLVKSDGVTATNTMNDTSYVMCGPSIKLKSGDAVQDFVDGTYDIGSVVYSWLSRDAQHAEYLQGCLANGWRVISLVPKRTLI